MEVAIRIAHAKQSLNRSIKLNTVIKIWSLNDFHFIYAIYSEFYIKFKYFFLICFFKTKLHWNLSLVKSHYDMMHRGIKYQQKNKDL